MHAPCVSIIGIPWLIGDVSIFPSKIDDTRLRKLCQHSTCRDVSGGVKVSPSSAFLHIGTLCLYPSVALFPARARVYRHSRRKQVSQQSGVSRVCEDVPGIIFVDFDSLTFTPRMRGCTMRATIASRSHMFYPA